MWKIFINYPDESKLTLTGKHKDIPLRLAIKYYNEYVAGRVRKAIYQRYPKKDFEPIGLFEKIEQLQMVESKDGKMKELVTHTVDDETSICSRCDNNDIGDEFCLNKCGAKHGWNGYERAEFIESEVDTE